MASSMNPCEKKVLKALTAALRTKKGSLFSQDSSKLNHKVFALLDQAKKVLSGEHCERCRARVRGSDRSRSDDRSCLLQGYIELCQLWIERVGKPTVNMVDQLEKKVSELRNDILLLSRQMALKVKPSETSQKKRKLAMSGFSSVTSPGSVMTPAISISPGASSRRKGKQTSSDLSSISLGRIAVGGSGSGSSSSSGGSKAVSRKFLREKKKSGFDEVPGKGLFTRLRSQSSRKKESAPTAPRQTRLRLMKSDDILDQDFEFVSDVSSSSRSSGTQSRTGSQGMVEMPVSHRSTTSWARSISSFSITQTAEPPMLHMVGNDSEEELVRFGLDSVSDETRAVLKKFLSGSHDEGPTGKSVGSLSISVTASSTMTAARTARGGMVLRDESKDQAYFPRGFMSKHRKSASMTTETVTPEPSKSASAAGFPGESLFGAKPMLAYDEPFGAVTELGGFLTPTVISDGRRRSSSAMTEDGFVFVPGRSGTDVEFSLGTDHSVSYQL